MIRSRADQRSSLGFPSEAELGGLWAAPARTVQGALAGQPRRWGLLPARSVGRRLLGAQPGALAAFALLGLFGLLALRPAFFAPNSPDQVNLAQMLEAPSAGYPLGTDQFGRCILSRLIFGARATLGSAALVLLATIALSSLAATAATFGSGFGRRCGERLLDVGLSLPTPVVAIAVIGLFGPGLLNGMLAVAATSWAAPARVLRALMLTESASTHVLAARSLGASPARVVARHVALGVMGRSAAVFSVQLGQIMLALSALSFLGLGTQPPTAEWASMLNEGRSVFLEAPGLMLLPGGAIFLTVAACNVLADAISARLDERT